MAYNTRSSSWLTHTRRFPRTTNPLNRSPGPSPPPRIPNSQLLRMVFDLTLGFVVVVLNMVEILLLRRLTRKLKVYEFFILSMSFSDLLFGLSSSLVLVLFFASPTSKASSTLTDVTYTLYFLFIVSSILHLIGIASDRLFAVHKPVLHNVKVTRRKVVKFILMIWAVSILSAFALYASNNFSTAFQQEKITYEEVNETTSTTPSPMGNQNMFLAQRLPPSHRPTGPNRRPTRPSRGPSRPRTGSPYPDRFTYTPRPTIYSTAYPTTSTRRPSTRSPSSRHTDHTRPERPTPVRIKRVYYVDVFQKSMQNALAYFIIFADVVLVTVYGLVVFSIVRHHRNNKSVTINNGSVNRVLVVCISIALAFVFLTCPYAVYNFIHGNNTIWTNMLLVANSGMNSIVFFVRGEYR